MENEKSAKRENEALTVKAEDQKVVATALLSPPATDDAPAVLMQAIAKAAAAYRAHLEGVLFPAELKRYAETEDKGKRRSYAPLHIYLCFEITSGFPLSSCLGELFLYRGERLADYTAFSLTADERAGIFLTEKALLRRKKRKKAANAATAEGFYLQNDKVIGYRRVKEGLPCRCRRRDVRKSFLQQWELADSLSYISPGAPKKREKRKKRKKEESGLEK